MNSRDRKLSQLYDAAWAEVKQAVDASDSEGLLTTGSPSDEYDDAVGLLVSRVLRGESITAPDLSAWFADRYGLAATSSAVGALVDDLTSIQTRLHTN
jgi:hypothetical protein